jgi:hypothetical protein
VNLPTFNLKRGNGKAAIAAAGAKGPLNFDAQHEQSRLAQRQADRWLIVGTLVMSTFTVGLLGLPLFLRGLWLQRRAQQSGLSMRPLMVTLIGYSLLLDGAANTIGWCNDLIANHALLTRVLLMTWGNFMDGGYFWHYNELGLGGSGAPGEKAWQIGLIFSLFTMRMAACIGFLQMKRWGHQWLIVGCWFSMVYSIGYITNMTIYGDIRYAGTAFPVIAWWIYNVIWLAPFLAIPYLHTVDREIFSD